MSESPSQALSAAVISEELSNVIDELRAWARTSDIFSGYSFSEAIQDRIDRIGSMDDAENVYEQANEETGEKLRAAHRGIPTLQARLLNLEARGLAAIEAAKEIEKVIDTNVPGMEKGESTELAEGGVTVIDFSQTA